MPSHLRVILNGSYQMQWSETKHCRALAGSIIVNGEKKIRPIRFCRFRRIIIHMDNPSFSCRA